MINYSWKNADASVVGAEHGLNVQKEFDNYRAQISEIVSGLYAKKDIAGNWLKWMNLGYNQDLVAEINAYAQTVKGKFDNLLVLGIGGSSLGGICITEAILKPYWNLLEKKKQEMVCQEYSF